MRWLLQTGLGLVMLWSAISDTAWAQFAADERADISLGGLDVESSIGWDNLVDQNAPVPVSFLFSNYSDRVIDAELFLVDHQNGFESSLGEVYLSQQGRRKLNAVRAMTDWYECFAELRVGSDVIWRRELALNTSRDFTFGVNFALVINDSGRALKPPESRKKPLPPVQDYRYYGGPQQLPMVRSSGRKVEYVQVKTWEVPTHFGPLLNTKAVVFPEDTFEADLNRAQWQAVADFMCQGGAVFVHKDSRKIIEQLQKRSYLVPNPPYQSGDLSVQDVGLGSICEYSDKLFSSDDSPSNEQIIDYVGRMSDAHIGIIAETGLAHRWHGGQADWNRFMVIGFFALYAFLSGFVTLLMFRRSRRVVGIYTACVVVVACICAAVVGGILRMSKGDLRAVTVTQPGAGGAVQIGRIEVFSAGARNTRVAVKGPNVDLQFVKAGSRYRRYNHRVYPILPFTWQRSLLQDEENAYQVAVGMPPWGSQRLHATACSPTLQPINVRLELDPNNTTRARLTIRNDLPFTLHECLLVVAYATEPPEDKDEPGAVEQVQLQQQPWNPPVIQVRTDLYATHTIGSIGPSESRDQTIGLGFRSMANTWDMVKGFSTGQISLPFIGRGNSAEAWLIGTMDESPIIEIDEARTEFIPDRHLHLFMQRLRPEDMPGISRLYGGDKPDESQIETESVE